MPKKIDSKLPFSQKLFYLDITTNLALKGKIEFCVRQLGGTVETFLDRKVRYVVTDKPPKDWPPAAKSKQSTDKKQLIDKKIDTTKSNVDKNQDNKFELMSLTSRGKLLQLASKTPNNATKSTVLETAERLGMKILTYRSILDFCKKYIKVSVEELNEQNQQAEQLNQQQAANSAKIKTRQLKAPFLKFEDKEEKFAPSYKEFDSWPSVCVETNKVANAITNPVVPKNLNTSKLLQPLNKKKQRVYFCEICSKEFTNMIEHVKTEQHQNYMNNEENYKELKSVIDSLPNWITLNDTNTFDLNEEFTDEESEFEDESSDDYDEDAYSSESKDTILSDGHKQAPNNSNNNSEMIVPASFTTPIKLYQLNNIFNNLKRDDLKN